MSVPATTTFEPVPDPRRDPGAVLARYDAVERLGARAQWPGDRVERVGGLVRSVFADDAGRVEAGFVEAPALADLDEAATDALIGEQVAHFAALRRPDGGTGVPFEWKVYGHDRPARLRERLLAAGFVAEPQEALVVGRVDDVLAATAHAGAPGGPAGAVVLREVHEAALDADAAAIAAVHEQVWGRDADRARALARRLVGEKRHDPWALRIHLAEVDGQVVSAAWLRLRRVDGAVGPFAGLWGGSTLPAWRRRGIYRALVAARVRQAVAEGAVLVQVDASPDSRPILTRLGLVALDWTQPLQWEPPERVGLL